MKPAILKNYILILYVLIGTAGLSQSIPTFSEIFGDSARSFGGASITSLGDSIYFSTFEQDLASSYQAANFIKTDPEGNQRAGFRFYKPGYYYNPGALHIPSSNYLICAGSSGPLNVADGKGTVFKFDRVTLDTLNTQYNAHGNISLFYGLAELSDGNYLFSGEATDTSIMGKAQAWMVKADTAGNELWEKTMSSDDYNAAYSTFPFNGGFYQPWGTAHRNTLSGNPADSAIFVDKYDNNGTLMWRDTFGIVGNDNIQGPFTGLKDGGGVIIVNQLDTSPPNLGTLYMPMVVYRFDSNGIIIWQHYFPAMPEFKYANSIKETSSGSLVICGTGVYDFISIDSSGHGGGAIFKLDRNGNLCFYQVYNHDSTRQDELVDITETADGGYACVGTAFERIGNTNYQRAWLLKVDSNGCLNGDCPQLHTAIDEIINEKDRFLVFPNPAVTQFTAAVRETAFMREYKGLRFTLYDLTGRMVSEQALDKQATTIQRDGLTEGMYLWHISDGDKNLANGKMVFK